MVELDLVEEREGRKSNNEKKGRYIIRDGLLFFYWWVPFW